MKIALIILYTSLLFLNQSCGDRKENDKTADKSEKTVKLHEDQQSQLQPSPQVAQQELPQRILSFPINQESLAVIIGWEKEIYGKLKLTLKDLTKNNGRPLWKFYGIDPDGKGTTPLQKELSKQTKEYRSIYDSVSSRMKRYRSRLFNSTFKYQEKFNYGTYHLKDQYFSVDIGGRWIKELGRRVFFNDDPEITYYIFKDFVVGHPSGPPYYGIISVPLSEALTLENKKGIFTLTFRFLGIEDIEEPHIDKIVVYRVVDRSLGVPIEATVETERFPIAKEVTYKYELAD